MNKKKKLFSLPKAGPIVIVAVGLIVAGVASAALVSYLSNEVTTADTVITSPIELSVWGKKWSSETTNSWYTDWIDLNKTVGDSDDKLYGGSYYEVRMDRRNLANQNIKNYLEIRIDPSSGALAAGDIDLTMQYKSGSTWVDWTAFPCQTGYASNSAYYRSEIRDIAPGLVKFRIGIDLNQALDPSATYKMHVQALDPDVVGTTSTTVNTCPY